jgi:hypothetical protein
MASIVNLRTARKQAARRRAEAAAAQNRLVHGCSRVEKALERAREEQARNNLDRHRIEAEDGP